MTDSSRERSFSMPSGAACAMLAIAALIALVFFHYFAEQRGDDSYIFFRIAENVAHGHGPVFNPGEHVEAYSSPLWLALLSIGRLFGADLVVLGRVLGWVFTAATLALTYRLVRALGASDRLGALAVLLLALLSGSLWYWAPSGLETPMYIALFTWAACTLVRGATWEWAVATALIGIARPEGVVLAVASVAGVWFVDRKRPRTALLAVALAVPAAYVAFRLAYFHHPFPNTYYAKATGRFDKRLSRGVEYALWPIVVTIVSAFVALFVWRRRADRRPLVVAAWSFALLGAVVFGGGDWMWGRRLALPAVPVALALVAWLASARVHLATRVAFAVGGAFLLNFDDLPWPDRKDYESFFCWEAIGPTLDQPKHALHLRFGRPIETLASAFAWNRMPLGARIEGTMTDAARDVAEYMRAHYPDAPLTAVNHAGALPYYSGFPIIDMTGLADEHIAHLTTGGLHEKYDAAYVLHREPRLVVLNARVEPTPEHWYVPGYWEGETALVMSDEFARHYDRVPQFWSWHYADGYTSYVLLYERRRE